MDDFAFQCGTGMIFGYVRTVDDLARVDLAAVRREIAAYVPPAGSSCSCCSGPAAAVAVAGAGQGSAP